MARAPRANVSKTSGQGISRLSYQKGRALGGNIKQDSISFGSSDGGESRRYAKTKTEETPPINISYGDTYEPTDLADIKAMGKLSSTGKAGVSLKSGGPKKWPK